MTDIEGGTVGDAGRPLLGGAWVQAVDEARRALMRSGQQDGAVALFDARTAITAALPVLLEDLAQQIERRKTDADEAGIGTTSRTVRTMANGNFDAAAAVVRGYPKTLETR